MFGLSSCSSSHASRRDTPAVTPRHPYPSSPPALQSLGDDSTEPINPLSCGDVAEIGSRYHVLENPSKEKHVYASLAIRTGRRKRVRGTLSKFYLEYKTSLKLYPTNNFKLLLRQLRNS
uniref:Uncharacterized protein n=1 Tax=Homalodisca liturata TaxID=320908 RepID=A0A1B6IVF3_9HEMI